MTGPSVVNGDDEFLLAPEVAAILRVDEKTLGSWRHRKIGPAWQRVGPRRIVYLRSAVSAFIDAPQTDS